MEIGPIAGIRLMPVIKSRPVDPELTAFFDIVPAARPEEDSDSGSGKKAAGAEEDESASEDLLDDDSDAAPAVDPGGAISVFA